MCDIAAMDLKSWREERGLSQKQVAEALGFEGRNPASQIERIENGKIKVDADLGEAIEVLTGGLVTVAALHATRLAWLKATGRARVFTMAEAA